MPAKVYVTKEFTFESAHHLVGYEGDCSKPHGHSYKLQVTLSGGIDFTSDPNIASNLMVLDFKDLKKMVKDVVISTHDHVDLNTIYENPTAEAMVVTIFVALLAVLPHDVRLESVKLWETATSFAEYRGETL